MEKAHDFDLCQQYLMNNIEQMKQQMEEYKTELTKQSELCPIGKPLFNEIDHCFKEFVDTQRNYLTIRNDNQLNIFKDHIKESELFEIITIYYPTIDQVNRNN